MDATLRHGRVELALHSLGSGDGPALLLLHALGGSGADWRDAAPLWPGRTFALDFAGHGHSGRLVGFYSPEHFAADADCALARVGPCALAGAGLGAYVALLLAGARPTAVRAALLLPGDGVDGAGPLPDFERPPDVDYVPVSVEAPNPDPRVRDSCRFVRPVEYAQAFAAAAGRLLLAEDGSPRPPWWRQVAGSPNAESVGPGLAEALARLAAV